MRHMLKLSLVLIEEEGGGGGEKKKKKKRRISFFMEHPTWVLLLLFLGFLSILRSSTKFLRWVYVVFLRPSKDLRSYGSWALITGATDGIGKALAFQFARQGLNLVLVGRNPDKLRQAHDAIVKQESHTQMRLVVVDFARDVGDKMRRRLEEAIEGLDVGVVVNNAGTTSREPLYFHEVWEELWGEIKKVNVEAATMVTKVVLPGMLRRRKGVVVFIGSAASAVLPSFPFSTVYAATKAYICQLSRSLSVEYKDMGIHVQCQIPLYVATKMVSIMQSSTFVPSPSSYARTATCWIGYESQCIPYWSHAVQSWLASLLPKCVLNSWLLRSGIRRRNKAKNLK